MDEMTSNEWSIILQGRFALQNILVVAVGYVIWIKVMETLAKEIYYFRPSICLICAGPLADSHEIKGFLYRLFEANSLGNKYIAIWPQINRKLLLLFNPRVESLTCNLMLALRSVGLKN